jgi:hypothetical protein
MSLYGDVVCAGGSGSFVIDVTDSKRITGNGGPFFCQSEREPCPFERVYRMG